MTALARTIKIDDITPQELATLFLAMRGEDQAAFFNAFKAETDTWRGAGWCQQCCEMSVYLNSDGQEIIAKLAEWASEPYVSKPA